MRPLAQCQALLAAVLASAAAVVSTSAPAQDRLAERAAMIETIKWHARSAPSAVEGQGIDPAVLKTMGKVPRHFFVPEEQRGAAYRDRPLPIGYGQTISQPFIVALMTDLINVGPGDVVLEIGTGSGYQAAVLSPLAAKVYSIEIIPELGERAAARLGGAPLRQCRGEGRRRLLWLACARAFRRHRGDCRCQPHPAAAGRTARQGGPDGRPRGRSLRDPVSHAGREATGRKHHDPAAAAGELCSAEGR